MNLNELLAASHKATGEIPEATLNLLTAQVGATNDPFECIRTISAQIGATESLALRTRLIQLRDRFHTELLSATIKDVQKSFDRSSDEGWSTWLTALADALVVFQHRFSLGLCEYGFPFDPSRKELVADIRRAVGCMVQSRWPETYEVLDWFSKQEVLTARVRAIFIMIMAQIDTAWFDNQEGALVRLEEAIKMAPTDGMILATLGDYFVTNKDLETARSYYRRAIREMPRISNGYVGMGGSFQNDDSLEEKSKYEQAEYWYRQAIACAGGDSGGYTSLLKLIGKFAIGAREAELLALVKLSRDVDPEVEYSTHRDVGQCYSQNKLYPDAQRWYEKAASLQPQWPDAYVDLGDLSRDQGDIKTAESHYQRAIEVGQECSAGYISLGRLYEEEKRWKDAFAVYSKFPSRPAEWASFARVAVGRMQAKLENDAEAERVILAELPSDTHKNFARNALEDIAQDYYQLRGDKESAKRLYGEILRILGDKYKGSYHNWVGNMHYGGKEYPEAIEEHRLAISTGPDTAVYHRNLSNDYFMLKEYDHAEEELDRALRIDGDRKIYNQEVAGLENVRGNANFNDGDYRQSITHYSNAVALESSEVVYHTNLAGAWKSLKEPGKLDYALTQAIQCYERAQQLDNEKNFTDEIKRLRSRKSIAAVFGEKALDYVNVVTPIIVEVAQDLVDLVKGVEATSLSEDLLSKVNSIRERLLGEFGVKIPGFRFRGNEFVLPGTYVIFINEIPLVSGTAPKQRRFCTVSSKELSQMGIEGVAGFDPLSGQEGAWIEEKDRDKVGSQKLWEPLDYLMRHAEVVIRKNLSEFVGHQEIVNQLAEAEKEPCAKLLKSSERVTALTTVCKALVSEEVPIQPFDELCSKFNAFYSKDGGLCNTVEQIRSLPSFRERLPGNTGEHSFLELSKRLETEIRRSLYEQNDRSVLAMEPERCQEVLAAIRNEVQRVPQSTLLVNDPVLRPFMRRLTELEFPTLYVLSRSELRNDDVVAAGRIDLGFETSSEARNFRSHHAVGSIIRNAVKNGEAKPSPAPEVTVFVNKDFETEPAGDKSMSDLLSQMQDELFNELGIVVPGVKVQTDSELKPNQFRIRLNGVKNEPAPTLGPQEFFVDDTVDRLTLFKITAHEAENPVTGTKCAVVQNIGGEKETCKQAGFTTWGPQEHLVLSLSAKLREAAAQFQSDELTELTLESLAGTFPDLVRIALERFSVAQLGRVLRGLLEEQISIRDLRTILESLLSLAGTTDVDMTRFIVFSAYADTLCPAVVGGSPSPSADSQLSDFVRTALKSYISHKYRRGGNTLLVYLLGWDIEKRIAATGTRPLTEEEQAKLQTAIQAKVADLAPTATWPVLLTTFEIRRMLRKMLETAFPRLAVLCYQELSPETSIQPIGRILWEQPQAMPIPLEASRPD